MQTLFQVHCVRYLWIHLTENVRHDANVYHHRSALSGCSGVRKVKRDSECRLEVLLSKLWSGTLSAQDPRLLTGLTFPAFCWRGMVWIATLDSDELQFISVARTLQW